MVFAQYNVSQVKQLYTTKQAEFNLTNDDLTDFVITDQYTDQHNGVTHIYMRQRVNGIEIFDANSSVHLNKNGQLISINNSFVSNAKTKAANATPAIGSQTALVNVAANIEMNVSQILSKTNAPLVNNQVIISDKQVSPEPIKIKLHYLTVGSVLKLVWNVEIFDNEKNDWWNVRVDAQDGSIIEKNNLVLKCNFNKDEFAHQYNFADLDLLKTDQIQDFGKTGSGSYNVYPLPIESPNHGARKLVNSTATTNGSPYGWHDVDGVAGAEYTITRGNNVYASEDTLNKNIPGFSPDGGSDLVFDFPYSITATSELNLKTAITNLFYWNNILHDIYYNYGFNEVAGNYQTNNYGKGGNEGDQVFADAQDGSGTSNANFSSPADGQSGRMQMYLWPTSTSSSYKVNTPAGISATYNSVQASFGQKTYGDIKQDLVLMKDSNATTTLGCSTLQNRAALAGKIALVDRSPTGGCSYVTKILNAQNSGAIAVIVIQNTTGTATAMTGVGSSAVTIPCFMITQANGNLLKANITDSITVNITINGNANNVVFDSDLDNGVMSHESGHGVSVRLTGGPSNPNCLSNAEQAGEGWSDFFALAFTAKLGDKGEDGRGVGTFVYNQPITGVGIRQNKYSRNKNTDPLTYADVKNSQGDPHYSGTVWATVLWDLYWNMSDKYGWSADLYTGTGGNNKAIQLVMDGLKLQPCNPGFLDSRNAILLADSINNGGVNKTLIWNTFARRGMGYSASQGSANSLTDGVAASDVPPGIAITGITDLEITEAIKVAPNPSTGEVYVMLPSSVEKVQINIIDVTGKMVLGGMMQPDVLNRIQLNLSNLNNGVYFISVNSGDKLFQTKLVLSK